MRNEAPLNPAAVAHFVRGELADALRSRNPYNVNLLLGGVDPRTGTPNLYWMDYLAALAEIPYAAHGYAQYAHSLPLAHYLLMAIGTYILCFRYYCMSILDKHHQPDISLERGLELLRMCTDELQRRLPIDYKGVSPHPSSIYPSLSHY